LGRAKLGRAFGLPTFAFEMFWPAKIFFGEKSLASKQIVAKISWGQGVTKFCLGTLRPRTKHALALLQENI